MLFYWLVIVRVGVLKTRQDHTNGALLHLGPDVPKTIAKFNKVLSWQQNISEMSMAWNGYLATAQCERCNKSSMFYILVRCNGLTHTWTGISVVLGLKCQVLVCIL